MSRIPPGHRVPYLVLGAFTIVAFGGPLAILVVVRGGPSALWPPDRAVEWIVLGLVLGLAIALFAACISVGRWHPDLHRAKEPAANDPGPSSRSTLGP
jgi:hypothetical protein